MQGYLRHLANFAEIGRSGSLGGAAGRLGTTVSVMSRSLAILENHFGVPLALRTARGVVPTEAGRLVLAEAEVMVDAGMRALEVGRTTGPVVGKVVFSAPREVLQLWLVDGLRDLIAAYPGIQLSILAADQIIDPRKERLDVSLRVGSSTRSDDIDCLAEFPVKPVLVCHPDFQMRIAAEQEGRITQAGLFRFGAFGAAGPFTLRASEDGQATREVEFAHQTIVTDVALSIALARSGAGVAGCLEPSVRVELAQGSLVEAFPGFGFPAVTLRVGTAKGHRTPAAQVVATGLSQSLMRFLRTEE